MYHTDIVGTHLLREAHMRLLPLVIAALALASCQSVNVISESPGSKGQDIGSKPASEVALEAVRAAAPVAPAPAADAAPAADVPVVGDE